MSAKPGVSRSARRAQIDAKMLGVERLRQIYAPSGLSIKPKATEDKLEMLKEFTRSLGLDPEKIIVRDTVSEPHRATAIATDDERGQTAALGEALREWIRREALRPSVD